MGVWTEILWVVVVGGPAYSGQHCPHPVLGGAKEAREASTVLHSFSCPFFAGGNAPWDTN